MQLSKRVFYSYKDVFRNVEIQFPILVLGQMDISVSQLWACYRDKEMEI